ncbi:hypothetical protein [Limnoglobus roseus]|uniref:Uncharacterized protein n=1 Tax=Limnoglobus roseus TaxID=2598579 RepID=A0A5C1AA02_9BACT|nr:hypothetical protein [Limnoglobus roseus]QEL15047.1 hypothetical protein PX52LOC_01953 [Limnoglobus roseus]
MSAPNDPDPLTDSALCTGDPLAHALSHLEPMPTTLGRDQLMFAAGAAGRDRDVAFWKRIVYGQTAAACLVVGVGLTMFSLPETAPANRPSDASMAATQPAPRPPQPMAEAVVRTSPPREETGDSAKLAQYLQLRSNVLAGGINVLPNPNAPAANLDVGKLEDSLKLPRGTFAIYGPPAKPKPPTDDQ